MRLQIQTAEMMLTGFSLDSMRCSTTWENLSRATALPQLKWFRHLAKICPLSFGRYRVQYIKHGQMGQDPRADAGHIGGTTPSWLDPPWGAGESCQTEGHGLHSPSCNSNPVRMQEDASVVESVWGQTHILMSRLHLGLREPKSGKSEWRTLLLYICIYCENIILTTNLAVLSYNVSCDHNSFLMCKWSYAQK